MWVTVLPLLLSACGDGGITPAAGGFGGGLEGDATFLVTLIVFEEESEIVDVVRVSCAPEGTLDLLRGSVTVGTDVPIDGGTFSVESKDVAIEGEFVTPERAEGEIRARTPAAEDCGVPRTGQWSADCDLLVTREGDGFSAEGGECGVTN